MTKTTKTFINSLLTTKQYITPTIEPIPNSTGIEGIGQGFMYPFKGTFYYNRIGSHAPLNKAFVVKREYNYCGRQRGDIDYFICCYYNESFFVLKQTTQPKKDLSDCLQYTNEELIKMLELNIEWFNQLPKVDESWF